MLGQGQAQPSMPCGEPCPPPGPCRSALSVTSRLRSLGWSGFPGSSALK